MAVQTPFHTEAVMIGNKTEYIVLEDGDTFEDIIHNGGSLAEKQNKVLSTPITIEGESFGTVESALQGLNTRKGSTYEAGPGIRISNRVISADTDSALSSTSTAPVQNKVVKSAIDAKQSKLLSAVMTIDNIQAGTVELALGGLNNKKLNQSQKGQANGIAELDENGKVPSSQLPSFVDDVVEGYYDATSNKFYEDAGHTIEIPSQKGKIYVSIDTNKTYRYSGSVFVVIASDLALGETSSTAYRGDRGKIAYDHSQATHARTDATKVEAGLVNGDIKINGTEVNVYTHPGTGTNPHGTTKSDIGLSNVGNFKAVSTVASQGLSDTEKSNARSNIGAGTSSFSGSYTDLTNKPTIPTVNDSTIKIQKNGIDVSTFTTNAASNKTINITMSSSDVGLGNVGNFKAVSTVASQGLSDTEKSNARANIGAGTSSLTLGNTASTAAYGNHTHTTTIAANSGTSELSLAAGTKYKITAGGTSFIFTTPSDTNTHRPIQVNGTEILGNNTTALNLKAGTNVTITNSSGAVTIAATDTKYTKSTTSIGSASGWNAGTMPYAEWVTVSTGVSKLRIHRGTAPTLTVSSKTVMTDITAS